MPSAPKSFMLLVYRMPAKPTAGRVAVWRQLKKAGAIYLQQSVCVFPENPQVKAELQPILRRIESANGEYHLLQLGKLPVAELDKLVQQFQEQTSKHYAEIIENCEVNFTKEIEFETFRSNFTYEEAEEIRNEFEKIAQWFDRVRARDWFGAPNRQEAADWLQRCERMLEKFEEQVYAAQNEAGDLGVEAPTLPRQRRNMTVVSGRG